MRNFIIFFDEKEGTSPLVRLLDNFDQISVVHPVGESWEPFDRHSCGWLSMHDLTQCFDMIFGENLLDMERLNAIYTKTANAPLEVIDTSGSIGFKMRFLPPHPIALHKLFRSTMIDLLKENDVTVFLAVRQDIFRWALSKYHGDGTGKPGHIQFKLASGKLGNGEIGKIYVYADRLEEILRACEESHARKRRLMKDMQSIGIRVHPLRYENFLADKRAYFTHLLEALELELPEHDLDAALQKGAYYKKVHSDDISHFVENHEEMTEHFGHRFVSW